MEMDGSVRTLERRAEVRCILHRCAIKKGCRGLMGLSSQLITPFSLISSSEV